MTYTFRGMTVPERVLESIQNYVERGVPTGGFLESVINNDLAAACTRADETNIRVLPAIVAYFYAEVPSECWGFAGAHDRWIKRIMQARKQKVEEQ